MPLLDSYSGDPFDDMMYKKGTSVQSDQTNVKPYQGPKSVQQLKKKNEQLDYAEKLRQQRISEEKAKLDAYYKKNQNNMLSGMNTPPNTQAQAEAKVAYQDKPTIEKVKDFAVDAALAILPEVGLLSKFKTSSKILKPLEYSINASSSKLSSIEDVMNLPDDHYLFRYFNGTGKEAKEFERMRYEHMGHEKYFQRLNNTIESRRNDLNNFQNLNVDIKDYNEIGKGKEWATNFIFSKEWKDRIKLANPDLSDQQIQSIRKSAFLRMPTDQQTFIKNVGSKNSFHGGQFTPQSDFVKQNISFRYFDKDEMIDNPLHYRSSSAHEFAHSQSSGKNLLNNKRWHESLEKSNDMPKLQEWLKGDTYIGSSEEMRSRALPTYMFAKEKGLLEDGKFTENTFNKMKEMYEVNNKNVPSDFQSYLFHYTKPSSINYLNKFYGLSIPTSFGLMTQYKTK